MTRGRTRGVGGDRVDLVAPVAAGPEAGGPDRPGPPAGTGPPGGLAALGPEHLAIVARCRRAPRPVAELAAGLDLPVGVVRVLVGDLVAAGLVRVARPVPAAEPPDESVLRDVINGLRAL
ncbi:DUF742 domain-containing protein [Streptomyces glaucosporus]